jgi:hypothetical protein
MLRAWLAQLRRHLFGDKTYSTLAHRQPRSMRPGVEMLEDRTTPAQLPGPLAGSPVLSDAAGHLFGLGNDHELYYSASGLGNDWSAVSGPYTAIAGDGLHDVFALGIDHTLYRCTAGTPTATLTGVQTLLQSYHSSGAQVVTVLDNGALQQSDDGVHFSTIGLGGPLTQLGAGQDSAGRQVLFALRQDGVLLVDASTGVTSPLTGVRSLIQSYHGNGAPVATLLVGGQLQQSDDGIHFATVDFGGLLTQIAAGQDSAGRQVLFALRQDGVLFVDASTGVTHPLTNVRSLLQSCTSNGAPAAVLLAGGQMYQSLDGVSFPAIDLGGPITQLAQGRNAAGQQLLYALRDDGALLEDGPAGVTPLETSGVQTMIQTQSGTCVPCIVFLQSGQFQQSTDGNPADVSTINFSGSITQLAEGRNGAGQQILYALRKDGALFVDASTGVTQPLGNVQTLIQSYTSALVPCITVLAGGQMRQSLDGVNFSTFYPGGFLTQLLGLAQIAAGQDSAGRQVLFALRNGGALFVDAAAGVTQPLSGVQTLVQSFTSNGVPAAVLLVGGQMRQSLDGVNFSTIDFGGTLTQIAAGQDGAGGQALFALRNDGVLFEDGRAGVTVIDRLVYSFSIQDNGSLSLDDWFQRNLSDPGLRSLARNDFTNDVSITYPDLLGLFSQVEVDGQVSAAEFHDLQTLVAQAGTLNMPGYVQNLANKLINGDPANASYQGTRVQSLQCARNAELLLAGRRGWPVSRLAVVDQ